MTYNYKGINIGTFLAGTNRGDDIGYLSFPGTNNIADVNANANDGILRPLGFDYLNNSSLISNNRYAAYSDFYASNKQTISAPAGTTHISGILIGGGGGGGGQGGGNNPDKGSDRTGAGGGGGSSGVQGFFFKYPYSSNLAIKVGSGGDKGTVAYKTNGGAGQVGGDTILYNNNDAIFTVKGGKGGAGGASASANANGSPGGSGGAKQTGSSAVTANSVTKYTPSASCTINESVAGQNGSDITFNGGAGGALSYLINPGNNYGRGGNGGSANGAGSGAGANDDPGNPGNNGFCRIYYLIE